MNLRDESCSIQRPATFETDSPALERQTYGSAAWPPTVVDEQSIILGMPQLASTGLSQQWTLRELGHRHWCALAAAAGRGVPDFHDVDGAPVYAAFCAVSLTDYGSEHAQENDRLIIRARLNQVTTTQMGSRQELSIAGRRIAEAELISTFVRRTGTGNTRISRVAPTHAPVAPAGASALAADAASVRNRRIARYRGFDLRAPGAFEAARFQPRPDEDFNGAGFLYFSSFINFVNRAGWHLGLKGCATPFRIDTFYRANIDPGQQIAVVLVEQRNDGSATSRYWRVLSVDDATILADIFFLPTTNGAGKSRTWQTGGCAQGRRAAPMSASDVDVCRGIEPYGHRPIA